MMKRYDKEFHRYKLPVTLNSWPYDKTVRSDGCCMQILEEIWILEQTHMLRKSNLTYIQLKQVQFQLNFQQEEIQLN